METKFIKVKKESNYTVVDNTFIQDIRLSWKAKGLMIYLLSLPEDWEIHLSEVENHASDGIDSLRSAIKELKNYAYLIATQKKNEAGRFCETVYTVIEKPLTEKPLTEKPLTEKPLTEIPTLLNTNKQSTNVNKVLKEQNTDITKGEKQKQIYEHYQKNYETLYQQKRLQTNKVKIDFGKCGKLLKDLFQNYSVEELFIVLDRAMDDKWIVSGGYNLSTIISSSQINKLLNGKPNNQKPYNAPENVGKPECERLPDNFTEQDIPF